MPQGVTLMIDEGALLKLRKANIDAGTSAVAVNRSGGAVQVLGTPDQPVLFRSYRDDTVGGNEDPTDVAAKPGDWGGIVLRDDSDMEQQGIYLNWINHADMADGGGKVRVGSVEMRFAPVHLIASRPTVSFNTIPALGRGGDLGESAQLRGHAGPRRAGRPRQPRDRQQRQRAVRADRNGAGPAAGQAGRPPGSTTRTSST